MLDPIVQAELKKQLPGAPVGDNPVGAEMYKNFALTDDAVLFFISQGQWTISAAGSQTGLDTPHPTRIDPGLTHRRSRVRGSPRPGSAQRSISGSHS